MSAMKSIRMINNQRSLGIFPWLFFTLLRGDIPMIHMIVEFCKADLLPIEESPIYQTLLQELGPEIASEFVYEVLIPPLEEPDV